MSYNTDEAEVVWHLHPPNPARPVIVSDDGRNWYAKSGRGDWWRLSAPFAVDRHRVPTVQIHNRDWIAELDAIHEGRPGCHMSS